MKRLTVLFSLLLILPGITFGGKYRQPAYITNFYFCNNPQRNENFVQPDQVFNQLRANDPALSAYIVLNLIADKGIHHLEVDILDQTGARFDGLKFNPVTAESDNWTYTATGRFGGSLPAGGIFIKVYDRVDKQTKEVIGTFRVMTAEW
jgi:hypothetical protein